MSNPDATRRLRRDARGQVTERRTARGVVYGLRFALPRRDDDGRPARAFETLGRSWEDATVATPRPAPSGCSRRCASAST